jgi:RHS repeat-associated protein
VAQVLSPSFAVRTASDVDWERTYCGYACDLATGLLAVRNRFYHPRLGIWVCRDPLGPLTSWPNPYQYVDSWVINVSDPFGLGFWSSFGEGLVYGALTAAAVVAGAAVLSVVGVPAGIITGTLFLIGVVGAGIAIGSVINDPSPENIGYTLGAFTGGAIVGGVTGRPLATRLSPKGHQPAPGWKGWSPKRDASQCWKWNARQNICKQLGNMMDTGPNPLSGAGAVAAAGGGISSSAHNLSQ